MSDEEFDMLWTSCEWREVIDKQRSQLKLLAEVVLEAHTELRQWQYKDGSPQQEQPCKCHACQLARKIVEVQAWYLEH